MQPYETVSINQKGKKLADLMNLKPKMKTTTQSVKSATKPKANNGLKIGTKQIKSGVIKEQLDSVLQRSSQMTEMKYSSKENKLNIKEQKIMQVLNYQNSPRFGPDIRKQLKYSFTREQLVKRSIDQIDNLLFRIRSFLNNRGMNGIYEQMIRTGAVGYEKIVSEFYDIEGFSDLLFANPSFWDAFERWKIERKLPDIPPGMQLMYIVTSTTLLAHMRKMQLEAPVPRKTNEKNENKNDNEKIQKTQLKVGGKL